MSLHLALYDLQRLLKCDCRQSVSIMQPAPQRSQHQEETLWIVPAVILPQAEFHGIHGGCNCLRFNSFPCKLLKSLKDQFFHLSGVIRTDTLQSSREEHLAEVG